MLNLYSRPDRPGDSRGILPLLAAAAIAGAIRGTVGSIQANQKKQRTKGYINANYRLAEERLNRSQGYARQDLAESLNARGLAQGGTVTASPIHAAMTAKSDSEQKTKVDGPAATTVGGQEVQSANEEMALEQQDLTQQRDTDLAQNKAGYNNDLLSAGVAGVNTGIEAYTAGKDLQQAKSLGNPAAERSKLHAMMLSGAAYDGVHPNDPLGEPTSAWSTHPRPTLADPDQTSASFNAFG